MNKSDLAKCLAEKMSVSQRLSTHFLDALQEVIADELCQNGTIMLKGFGNFAPWEQAERLGRNPRNGASCTITARISVKFKPGKELLRQLNAGFKK